MRKMIIASILTLVVCSLALSFMYIPKCNSTWKKMTPQDTAWPKNFSGWAACYMMDVDGPERIDKIKKACYIGILKEKEGVEIQTIVNIQQEKRARVQKIEIWRDQTGLVHINTKSGTGKQPEKGQ